MKTLILRLSTYFTSPSLHTQTWLQNENTGDAQRGAAATLTFDLWLDGGGPNLPAPPLLPRKTNQTQLENAGVRLADQSARLDASASLPRRCFIITWRQRTLHPARSPGSFYWPL